MTSRVRSIPGDAEIETAVHLLLKHGLSGAPVVDSQGALLGVLSEHDCARALAEAVASGWPAGKVADHATAEAECVAPSEDVLALASRFAKGRHRRLLVVEGGRLAGIITRRDLMKSLQAVAAAAGRKPRSSTYELIDERHRKLD